MGKIEFRPDPEMANLHESERRKKERELLREVEKAQTAYHESAPEKRAPALERYLQAVNRFSQFVLGKETPPAKRDTGGRA